MGELNNYGFRNLPRKKTFESDFKTNIKLWLALNVDIRLAERSRSTAAVIKTKTVLRKYL